MFEKYYQPEEEGPEAKMMREAAAEEDRVHKVLVELHNSIPPEASRWPLFTFAERKRFGISRHRK